MALVVVVIICVVLLVRNLNNWCSDREFQDNYKQGVENARGKLEAFQRHYTDKVLESTILNKPELVERIKGEIRECSGILNPSRMMILMMAMAEHGKIPEEVSRGEIWVVRNKKDKEQVADYKRILLFMYRYNQVLMANGVSEELLICPFTKNPLHPSEKYTLPIRIDVPPMFTSSGFFWDIVKDPNMSVHTFTTGIRL